MLSVPEKLNGITHPLITSVHMKKDYGAAHHAEDVLVIETNFPESDQDYEIFDSYLMDLLLDLEDLKNKAESHFGKIDRVDIRTHH